MVRWKARHTRLEGKAVAVISIIRSSPISDRQAYEALVEKLDLDHKHPLGLLFHAAGEVEGAWQIVDVWYSAEYAERFERDTLEPALQELTGKAEAGGAKRYELHHLVTP